MNLEDIQKRIKSYLDEDRYQHALRVAETCRQLAQHYKVDPNKAALAGLLHDIARRFTPDQLINLAEEADIPITEVILAMPGVILHGPIGAIVAQQEFGVTDPEVLTAIRFHTLGAEELPIIGKILFLADKIEPGRTTPGVEEIRKVAYQDLDKALLLAYDNTLRYLLEQGQLISEQTIRARNKAILKLGREE